ncbi:NAD(P)H-dependent glycerol-3-phosphate dehydrogenase [Vallitalea okinawensis]|uniref:NAD(P)H-dependent glycerol-3-phosphate dehydrogenase n=1 Tax=Vallitalea okinawensis TaxID=2078660 RepID=UPI000CFAB019|nr:NAD(P)H-dependent glycerol-3-phosphate dehydrogenase [Vallitalea okinawensis]
MKNIAIMGSGGWGIALAILLHNNGHNVTIWSYSESECKDINENHKNTEYLPDIDIPKGVKATNDYAALLTESDIIVVAIPSSYLRQSLELFKDFIRPDQEIINVAKGLEKETLKTLSQVIEEILPNNQVAVLSGPSHAEEVARKIPTTCAASSKSKAAAVVVQDLFMSDYFRVYTNPDLVGVELGGALKNVIALAAGASDGLGYGDNTKAALMTRGIAEISRLGIAMGADFHTFNGLSGVGDLIVTCTSMHSRNRRAGILLGKGKSLEETLDEVHMVVEGVHTAQAALAFAKEYKVEMPIVEKINQVLFEGKDAHTAVKELMLRHKKGEHLSYDLMTEEFIEWKMK